MMAEETLAKMHATMLARSAAGERKSKKSRTAEFAVLGAVLCAALGHLLIKSGLNGIKPLGGEVGLGLRVLSYFLQPIVLMGLTIYALGTAMWVFAVSKREISYLFPLSALNYVVVALGGQWLFGESIPAVRWLGILVVICGVWLMQRWGHEEAR